MERLTTRYKNDYFWAEGKCLTTSPSKESKAYTQQPPRESGAIDRDNQQSLC